MRGIFVLVALLSISQPALAEENEQAIRDGIEHRATALLAGRQFDTLNRLAEQYRISGERTPSGIWKLSLFYAGLRMPPSGGSATDAQWQGAFNNALDWVRKAPSPAASIALANLHIGYAWKIRGTGTRQTVPRGAWQPFFAQLRQADEILGASKTKASVDPQWYAEMIELAREEQWQKPAVKAIFLEGMKRGRYYNDVDNQIMQRLEPLWSGSAREMEGFANYAADQTRDRLGEEMYTWVYWHISNGCGCVVLGDTLADWGKMKAGFQDILKRYPSQWNVNGFAAFACRAGDRATLRSLMQRLTTPQLAQWRQNATYYNRCRAWAFRG